MYQGVSIWNLSLIGPVVSEEMLENIYRWTEVGSRSHTHYHNGNLIWGTVSRRVDEVIPSDHPRRVANIRLNLTLTRSSYYYDKMFIICLFLTFFLILTPVLVF